MGQSAKPRRSREEHPTPEQVALIAEYVRQRKALGIWPPQELAYFTTLAKEIGFWRLRKDIEQTAEMYAKSIAPPVRYIGYPPSASDPPPLYKSWYDFLETVTWTKLRRFCLDRANKANKRGPVGKKSVEQMMKSSNSRDRVEGYHVWRIVCAAKGRCMHCGSLAVEGKRARFSWGVIGRRVGSLEHIVPLHRGGDNTFANLGWSCLCCNHLDKERERAKGLTACGAMDSGGFYPPLLDEPNCKASELIVSAKYTAATGNLWNGDEAAFLKQEIPCGFESDDGGDEEMWPDHEYPQAMAMWRDTFS